jgi:uncharacterized protein (TIGR02246 family)
MDPDRPFFGIQSPMLEDRSARPGSIEEMAARYVDAIRQAQPKGPYLLGGFSFGGVIATEMARKLKQQGQDVAHLLLLDVIPSPSARMDLLRRVDERLPALMMLPALTAPSDNAADRERAQSDAISRLSDTLSAAAQNLLIANHYLAIWSRFAPAEIDVPATHFVPERRSLFGALLLPARSRGLPVRAVKTVSVPGDHFSMLSSDHARGLAAQLDAALDAADPREGAHDDAGDARSTEREEASVRAFLQRYVDGMRRRDAASLGEMFAVDCISVSPGEGVLVGGASMKEHYKRKMPTLVDARIHVHDWRVFVLAGGRAACAVGQLDSDQMFAKGERRVSYRGTRVTVVLEKQAGAWTMVHTHYSLPVGGPLDTIG